MKIAQIQSMTQIDANAWDSLAQTTYPFLQHAFLLALEQSGAVCEQTGWIPAHLLMSDENAFVAFMPLYLKTHSWGEYVFDQSWAQAYQQNGLRYYPKWLTAIPLTPCQGSRIIMQSHADRLTITAQFLSYIKQLSAEKAISSWHCLFPDLQQVDIFRQLDLHIRENVQFHWFNKGYKVFDDFLSELTARKRKMIKRERERIQALGIRFLHLKGKDVSAEQWQIFFQFYTMTYFKKGGLPYLNLAFFQQLAATMGEQLLLIFAMKEHDYIAATLSFVGKETLYGRYWGCVEEYSSLHFETCYYQGIDFCIEHQISRFDSGAQGEHKISRGFEPVTTYSAHWIDNAVFDHAIKHFLAQEQQVIEEYKNEATSYLPYKTSSN